MSNLTLSVVIPALNEASYLPHLLHDLTQQTYSHFEIIVVDGGSTDDTVALTQKQKAHFHHLNLVTSPQKNVCFQRNLGATQAQTDWLIFMDADNRLPSYFLQGIKYRLEAENPDVFTTYFVPDSQHPKDKAIATVVNAYTDVAKNSSAPSAMESMLGIRTSVFHNIDGFNPKIHFGESLELLKKSRQHHYRFEVFKDPQYTYSFRRYRQQGTLSVLRNTAQFTLASVLNIKESPKKIAQRYPMTGGSQFKKSPETSTAETIIQKASKLKFPTKIVQALRSEFKSHK